MARRPMTPARRKRRTIRMAIALPILLAVLVLVLDYPILTAGQALRATQKRYFFGPGEVLTSIDFSRGYNKFKIGQSDRYYILRWGDWYAWCSVNHYGLFWQSGALDAVENDPSLPLVPLVVSDWAEGAVLVVCNDPDIARVEIEFPRIYLQRQRSPGHRCPGSAHSGLLPDPLGSGRGSLAVPGGSARPWLCRGWYSDLPVPPARELGGGLQHPRP